MEKLIPLFGKWYTKEVLKYKTWCTSKLSEYNLDTSAEHPEMDDDIVQYSFEKRRIKDKEP